MDQTNLHITEYRGEQLIDFFGITSFKVQNHGEAVVEINTIPVYPGQTKKIIEEDGTFCDFTLHAKFTEENKIPKFKTIYKQFGNAECYPHLHPDLVYTATLYNYEQGDIVEFSQNIAGHTILTRSFDGGVTFLPENDIDLGFVEANVITTYDRGGSLDTNAIQFRNDDLVVNSEIFVVGVVAPIPLEVQIFKSDFTPYTGIRFTTPWCFSVEEDSGIFLNYKERVNGVEQYFQIFIGQAIGGVIRNIDFPPSQRIVEYYFVSFETGATSEIFPYPPPEK